MFSDIAVLQTAQALSIVCEPTDESQSTLRPYQQVAHMHRMRHPGLGLSLKVRALDPLTSCLGLVVGSYSYPSNVVPRCGFVPQHLP
jgi:hypothetical protein